MNGIKEHQRREPLERWWNYRGLWRESLNERPSAAFVYRGLLISYICLCVLFIYLNPLSSIEDWIPITLQFMVPFIVYGVLWHWGKTTSNRHVISVLMYLMLFLIGLLVAYNVGFVYGFFKPVRLEASPYDAYRQAYSIWYGLFDYLAIPALLVSPILVMWIQGWRQALIFLLIIYLPYALTLRISAGLGL